MSGAAFLRIKKLTGGGIIGKAARHNRRTDLAEYGASESIDPARSHLNQTIHGHASADAVAQLAKDLMAAAGVTVLRKDAVMGLEVIFSLPANHQIDDLDYFTACTKWAADYFGGIQNILSSDIHRDEAQRHCHVLILPLLNGKMNGGKMMGYRSKLLAMQQTFFDDVASHYSLKKAPARLIGASKRAAANAVLQLLKTASDPALKSKAWATIRDGIERDPAPYLRDLGIELQPPSNKLKTMAQIFTGKGKGKGKSNQPKSIDFAPPEKRQSLCSVDFRPKPAPPAPPTDTPILDVVRIRESELDPDTFKPDLGEFVQRPPKSAQHQKKAANQWVAAALHRKGGINAH